MPAAQNFEKFLEDLQLAKKFFEKFLAGKPEAPDSNTQIAEERLRTTFIDGLSPKSAKDSRILIQPTCIQMVFCSNMNLVTVLEVMEKQLDEVINDFNKHLEEMNDKSAYLK